MSKCDSFILCIKNSNASLLETIMNHENAQTNIVSMLNQTNYSYFSTCYNSNCHQSHCFCDIRVCRHKALSTRWFAGGHWIRDQQVVSLASGCAYNQEMSILSTFQSVVDQEFWNRGRKGRDWSLGSGQCHLCKKIF